MEAVGLISLYLAASYDDCKTKTISIKGVTVFGIIGIIINIIIRKYSAISIAGGLAVGAVMYLFSVITNEKIGKGDAIIIAVTGIYIGFVNTIILLWVSSIIAAIVGLIMTKGKENRAEIEIPFVPFLLIGYVMLLVINAIRGVVL